MHNLRPALIRAIQPQIDQALQMREQGATTAQIVDACGTWAADYIGLDSSTVPVKVPSKPFPARYRRRHGYQLPTEA